MDFINRPRPFTENDYLDIKTDIYRIENNIKYISDKLNDMGYYNEINYNPQSHLQKVLFVSEINRLRNNVNILMDAFEFLDGMEIIYIDINQKQFINFVDINKLENNLKLLNYYIDCTILDNYICGESIMGNNNIIFH